MLLLDAIAIRWALKSLVPSYRFGMTHPAPSAEPRRGSRNSEVRPRATAAGAQGPSPAPA